MARKQTREISGFSLSFLDVMACGLGAVVLLLTLAQKQVFGPNAEEQRLTTEHEELQSRAAEVEKEIARLVKQGQLVRDEIKDTSGALAKLENQAAKLSDAVDKQHQNKASLIEGIKQIKVSNPEDVIKTPDAAGEENYLIGLRVKGARVGILVDTSASMTDERLIDIIRRKNSSDADRKNGPKWRRTIRTVRWLLARLPRSSQVSVVAYDEKARRLGKADWTSATDEQGLTSILSALEGMIPEGGTSLQEGLQKMRALSPTNLYVITDGLPTKGDTGWGRLSAFSKCGSLLGSSSKVSGECRAMIFEQTVKSNGLGSSCPVNVILLPIEGDPEAPAYYWTWTASTRGLFIAPAQDWP